MDKPARDAAEAYYDHLSLYINSSTTSSAKLSCGGVVEACLDVAKGKFRNAFAIVRPPGHHAEPDEHMGFCFFNNVAVAARVVQQDTPLKRILILDWQVAVPLSFFHRVLICDLNVGMFTTVQNIECLVSFF
jgi:histone deacetylase 6